MTLLTFKEMYIWAVLMIITCIAFFLGDNVQYSSIGGQKLAVTALLVLGFFKVRLVIFYFMEVRHAPIGLRVLCDVWIAAASIALVCEYWFGFTKYLVA